MRAAVGVIGATGGTEMDLLNGGDGTRGLLQKYCTDLFGSVGTIGTESGTRGRDFQERAARGEVLVRGLNVIRGDKRTD